ncbi:hypothetical protein SPRG_08122 [Saprolegnia parasitica CBS 223.65]|uniref:CHORD domain-containing protein n=1 Tax=Saprolegnia parasitica (strain CBS 223.65) TaxID=695850 RepID=A0A067CJW9_SAPPC|nr:hypothetical protein SPRG_08122 [Saprolegnia parasitica CBS 223.65]KDO26831.1 hypothetical protein SPRG_08122 [Saprolegnia parasitica CBS 223.65]|eukprot:XP_012202477.1 hypothetical protein SPRG_08122 [Saprolegnia parasitica CBS 223.65]
MGGAESIPVQPEGARLKKIYLHFEEGDEAHHLTLKLTIPSKWAGATVDRLKEKRPNNKVDASEYHLERSEGRVLRGDETIHDTIKSRDDVYVKLGPSTFKHKKDAADEEREKEVPKELVQCKNFGCREKFVDSENHGLACRHHKAPPTFHDTKKGWSCCSSKMVYDWDDFEKIEPCAVGFHSAVGNQAPVVAETPARAPVPVVAAPAAPVKSIDDYNKSNPTAVTSISSITAKPVAPKRTDGKAKCVNYGCQVEYFVDINDDKSCAHHAGAPVFHDSGKYWSCCPKDVKYDFDEFLKVPGCVVSAHKDVRD